MNGRNFVFSLFFALTATAAQAESYRCEIGGRMVYQESPCAQPGAKAGKYRCYVDGEVIYSSSACSTIKSKETLEREAREAEAADVIKRQVIAKQLEVADRANFPRRILTAQRAVAHQLRDPDSARFHYSVVSWFSGSAVVCGAVSGRNGFGGYSDAARFFAIDDLVTIDDGKAYKSFGDYWLRYCGPI